MAIAGIPQSEPVTTTQLPDSNPYRTATIVNIDTNLDSMVGFIDGAKWTVDYYNQIKAEDDMVSQFDQNLPNTLVQYMKISKLDIHVTTTIEPVSHPDINGTAYITIGITPMQGDIIKVSLSGGREALLTVVEAKYRHYNLSDVFEIEYKLDSFIDMDPTKLHNLEEKVVRRYLYDSNYLNKNSNPLILNDTALFNIMLIKEMDDIRDIFMRVALDKESNFLRVPEMDITTIDIGVQYCYMFCTNLSDHRTQTFEVLSDDDEIDISIWHKVIGGDDRHLKSFKVFNNVVSPTSNRISPLDGSVYWKGVRQIVSPVPINENLNPLENVGSELGLVSLGETTLGLDYMPTILPITNDSYLFSENFYNGTFEVISILESLVLQRLRNEELLRSNLEILINDCRNWSPINQYYYLPILLVLIKYSTQNNYVQL